MDLDDIRSQINDAFKHEEQTKTAADYIRQRLKDVGISWTCSQQTDCLNFIKAYIRETPDLIEAVFHAAAQNGVMDQSGAIFKAALDYWAEPHDYIPDKLGLLGLADDAYLTHKFLETVSSLHATRTGHPLLSIDLGPPNREMRNLVGEPVASALDAAVGEAVAGQMIQAGLQQLTGFPSLNLEDPKSYYEMQNALASVHGSGGGWGGY